MKSGRHEKVHGNLGFEGFDEGVDTLIYKLHNLTLGGLGLKINR